MNVYVLQHLLVSYKPAVMELMLFEGAVLADY